MAGELVSTIHLAFRCTSDLIDARSVSFNCLCQEPQNTATLRQLRVRMMIRLGFAAQRNNPPPGMTELLNDFLFSAQQLLYRKYTALRVRRLFSWTLEEGVRHYGIRANDEDLFCGFHLDPYKTREWVGIEDPNGAWVPLAPGISPEFYSNVAQRGRPTNYEIRQCVEVFPAPDAQTIGYKLWVKGTAELLRFEEDDDPTTLDSELVFLWALANAQTHYGKNDATATTGQAQTILMSLVAGTHGTNRYVPGEVVLPTAQRPVFPYQN